MRGTPSERRGGNGIARLWRGGGGRRPVDRVSVLIGPDGRIAVAYAEVVPAEHPDQVLADLDRLG